MHTLRLPTWLAPVARAFGIPCATTPPVVTTPQHEPSSEDARRLQDLTQAGARNIGNSSVTARAEPVATSIPIREKTAPTATLAFEKIPTEKEELLGGFLEPGDCLRYLDRKTGASVILEYRETSPVSGNNIFVHQATGDKLYLAGTNFVPHNGFGTHEMESVFRSGSLEIFWKTDGTWQNRAARQKRESDAESARRTAIYRAEQARIKSFETAKSQQVFLGEFIHIYQERAVTDFLTALTPGNFITSSQIPDGLKFIGRSPSSEPIYTFEDKTGKITAVTASEFNRLVFPKHGLARLERSVSPERVTTSPRPPFATEQDVIAAAKTGYAAITQRDNAFEITLPFGDQKRTYTAHFWATISEFNDPYVGIHFDNVTSQEEAEQIFDALSTLHDQTIPEKNRSNRLGGRRPSEERQDHHLRSDGEILLGEYRAPGSTLFEENERGLSINFTYKYGPAAKTQTLLLALVDNGLIKRTK